MKLLLEHSNQIHEFDGHMSGGGEGDVFLDSDNPRLLLKLYHDQEDIDVERCRHLIANEVLPSEPSHMFCFPRDLALDPTTKKVVGIVLRRACDSNGDFEGIDLAEVFESTAWLPFAWLVRVAKHYVKCIQDLHRAGYIRRDTPNSFVFRSGQVAEIDIDSLSFTAPSGSVFVQSRVKPDFVPPELQDKDLATIPATKTEDLFGLAVVLWLLMRRAGNEHPFDCKWERQEDRPKRRERIREQLWPWSGRYPGICPPDGSPPLSTLAPGLCELFKRAFDERFDPDQRPTPDEWLQALEQLDIDDAIELSSEEWECVNDGTGPPPLRVTLPSRTCSLKLVGAAAAIVLFGAFLGKAGLFPKSLHDRTANKAVLSRDLLPKTLEPPPASIIRLADIPESNESGKTPPIWDAIRSGKKIVFSSRTVRKNQR